MTDNEDPTVDELRERQLAQERASREAQQEADSEEEARTNDRRAEKAHYLSEKLAEQEQADREAGGVGEAGEAGEAGDD